MQTTFASLFVPMPVAPMQSVFYSRQADPELMDYFWYLFCTL